MSLLLAIAILLLLGWMLVMLGVAVRRHDIPAVVNIIVVVAATVFPLGLDLLVRWFFDPNASVGLALPLWIAVAGSLHAFGMLGPYDTIRWWDVLTHTLSAALLAALVYASLIVVLPQSSMFGDSRLSVATLTILLTLAAGVFWEIIELIARDLGERYDVEPVLVHYGWRDTVIDLGFDSVGAVLIVLLDIQLFVPLASQFPSATRTLLLLGAVVVVVGSVLLGLLLKSGE